MIGLVCTKAKGVKYVLNKETLALVVEHAIFTEQNGIFKINSDD